MSNKAGARCEGSVAKDDGAATDRIGHTENLAGTDDIISSSLGLEEYEMENKRRGLALIFNQERFATKGPRRGTNVDRDNLEKRLKGLNFEVKAYNDSTKETVLKEITKAAKADHSDADCFLLVFLSHGENGQVHTYDDKINIQEITSMFKGDKCKSLVGKPKIFILQACRGNKFDDLVTPCGADDSDMDEEVEDACAMQTLPAGADFIMCYSTAEGYYSIRNPNYGSWYIQDLCELLQYGDSLEFTYLLTLVTKKVSMRSVEGFRDLNANGKKQLPCFASMLTKKLYFRPKSSTSLCVPYQSLCCFSTAADRTACAENLTETVSLIKRSTGLDPAEEYKMDNKQRGLALILTLDDTGNNADRDTMEKRLNELNFNVVTYNNSNKEEVFNKITEAAKADHSDADCFLLVYLSHGNNGDETEGTKAQVFDDETVQKITSLFKGDKCKSLVGKPKIFILQASRGETYDDPVTACCVDEMAAEDARPFHTLPAGADFIICYSVAAGHSSHQDATNGSWYIQDLCKMLQEYGNSLEFTELLTLVNRKVSMRSVGNSSDSSAIGKKQIPCFASMLTKKLYFQPKKE